ncbi:MAG: FMN-dependent NADH-azoreductase, partial [Planctomycetota bacterium]
MVAYARGGEYTTDSETEPFDLQTIYVKLIFRFTVFEEIRSIVVGPTLQDGPNVAVLKRQEA